MQGVVVRTCCMLGMRNISVVRSFGCSTPDKTRVQTGLVLSKPVSCTGNPTEGESSEFRVYIAVLLVRLDLGEQARKCWRRALNLQHCVVRLRANGRIESGDGLVGYGTGGAKGTPIGLLCEHNLQVLERVYLVRLVGPREHVHS